VTLERDDRQIFQVSAAVGAPNAPTPTGHFFVTEVLQLTDPGDAYGPYALGLSGFSNTYFSFDGGPGQIAIHGTNQPQVIGGYASHGCVRLTNPDITALASQVPAGTPVDIVA
jgi:lipoprotein-anchoring transpeptidase ErfK/SrfK